MSETLNGSALREQEIIDLIVKAVTRRVIIDMDCCNVVIAINPDIVYWDAKGLIGDVKKVERIITTVIKNCGSLEILPCKSSDCLASTLAQGLTDNVLKLAAELSDRFYEDAKRTLMEALVCEGALNQIDNNDFIDNNNVQAQIIRRYYGQYCC